MEVRSTPVRGTPGHDPASPNDCHQRSHVTAKLHGIKGIVSGMTKRMRVVVAVLDNNHKINSPLLASSHTTFSSEFGNMPGQDGLSMAFWEDQGLDDDGLIHFDTDLLVTDTGTVAKRPTELVIGLVDLAMATKTRQEWLTSWPIGVASLKMEASSNEENNQVSALLPIAQVHKEDMSMYPSFSIANPYYPSGKRFFRGTAGRWRHHYKNKQYYGLCKLSSDEDAKHLISGTNGSNPFTSSSLDCIRRRPAPTLESAFLLLDLSWTTPPTPNKTQLLASLEQPPAKIRGVTKINVVSRRVERTEEGGQFEEEDSALPPGPSKVSISFDSSTDTPLKQNYPTTLSPSPSTAEAMEVMDQPEATIVFTSQGKMVTSQPQKTPKMSFWKMPVQVVRGRMAWAGKYRCGKQVVHEESTTKPLPAVDYASQSDSSTSNSSSAGLALSHGSSDISSVYDVLPEKSWTATTRRECSSIGEDNFREEVLGTTEQHYYYDGCGLRTVECMTESFIMLPENIYQAFQKDREPKRLSYS